MNNFIKSSLSP